MNDKNLPGTYPRRTVLTALGAGLLLLTAGTGRAAADPPPPDGPFYLDRAAWGADESLRLGADGTELFPPVFWPVQTVTVHHTGTVNDDPDPATRVRSIYRNQAVGENFGDVGYHFFIDEAGRVYEGRWSGADGVPGFDPQGRMVNASHVAGFNAGNVGIALLGTLTDRPATRPAVASLTLLLAAILRWHDLDPLATVAYVNPISAATATVARIPGHQDWAPTLCPGSVHAELPAIRSAVATLAPRLAVTSGDDLVAVLRAGAAATPTGGDGS